MSYRAESSDRFTLEVEIVDFYRIEDRVVLPLYKRDRRSAILSDARCITSERTEPDAVVESHIVRDCEA